MSLASLLIPAYISQVLPGYCPDLGGTGIDGTDCKQYERTIDHSNRTERNMAEKSCYDTAGPMFFTRARGTAFECSPTLPLCMDRMRPQFNIYTAEKGVNNVL